MNTHDKAVKEWFIINEPRTTEFMAFVINGINESKITSNNSDRLMSSELQSEAWQSIFLPEEVTICEHGGCSYDMKLRIGVNEYCFSNKYQTIQNKNGNILGQKVCVKNPQGDPILHSDAFDYLHGTWCNKGDKCGMFVLSMPKVQNLIISNGREDQIHIKIFNTSECVYCKEWSKTAIKSAYPKLLDPSKCNVLFRTAKRYLTKNYFNRVMGVR